MQQRLAQNKARLLAIIGDIENRPEGMGCGDNAERVLEKMREGKTLENRPSNAGLDGQSYGRGVFS